MTPTSIAAYLALFAATGFLFLFAALLIGRFLRPREPSTEKGQTYECGEVAVGTSFVQFDLRFYVVALLFIVFDVEVAFFFPWATVFGKAVQLTDPRWQKVVEKVEKVTEARAASTAGLPTPPAGEASSQVRKPALELSGPVLRKYRELGMREPDLPDPALDAQQNTRRIESGARKLALAAALDVGVFFAVLLVGFAYVWTRGDLDWIRPASWRQVRSSPRIRSIESSIL